MDGWTSCLQFSAQSIAIPVLAMVRLGVRVGRGAHMLEISPCQWRFVGRQGMMTGPTAAEQNDGDKRRKNSPGKITTVSVGQGEPPGHLLTVIHKARNFYLKDVFAMRLRLRFKNWHR